MTENPKEKQSEDYQFINEKIVPKRKNRWMKKLGTLLFVICMAAVFGLVARIVFLVSGEQLSEWLGIGEERQKVDLPRPTEGGPRITISPTPRPVKTPTPAVTIQPTEVLEPTSTPVDITPGELLTVTPQPGEQGGSTSAEKPAKGPEMTQIPEKNVTPVPTGRPEENNAQTYLSVYEEVRRTAEEVSGAFVTVEAIEQGVDWFQEVYEKRTRTTGLILGNDGVDLLILVGTEQFSGATSIEVYFGGEMLPGRMYSMDRDYGLAVIAVPLELIPEEILTGVRLGLPAESEDIAVGLPVLALGAPNGYEGSMEFGMITSLGSTVSVTDGEVAYFTTNINNYTEGHGFVVNLEGEILGMITHTHKENPEDGIFSAVSLDSIRGVIVKLLNNAERSYFGIKGQDIPKNLKNEYGLTAGVYVSEVENASPALNAGIKTGDMIVSLGGKNVEGIRSFSDMILECSTREIVQVKILRKTEDGLREMTLEVALTGKK
ncbi:MAG: PDZ domain-containing protein [Lachnospiraceae bacterium]|nr:PDZ domain-containing protein [Lachnospiraceae bacterium]